MDNMWVLAQAPSGESPSRITTVPVTEEETQTTTVVPDSNAPVTRTVRQRSPIMQLLPFILIFVVMYLLLFRGPRKKQQQHKQMVQSLKKNDRVRTIGGIIGTVVDVKGDEITLKVDESNNTKIRVASSAIGKNLSEDKG
jgi:preprotein translocase subunit YajC